MNEKYESQMKKGVLDMLVLKLLEREPKYGYQIITELREKSKERFALKEGTLYPILYRLEDDGLVISRWSEASEQTVTGDLAVEKTGLRKKGLRKTIPRKYYGITDSGLVALGEIGALWEEINKSVSLIMSGNEE
ncbi:MAG: PadR family transcriptional regulator [Lachnospiraceae bacterium]